MAGANREAPRERARRRSFSWPQRSACFIGREAESARLAELLRPHSVVALCGPLGIGKTALALNAIETAAADGSLPPPAYASLAGVQDPRDILELSAKSLGRRRPATDAVHVTEALVLLLAATPCTLVWDDLQEAQPEAVSVMLGALAAAPGRWRLVVVSREPIPGALSLPVLHVPPLTTDASRRIIADLESARGCSLHEDLATWAGGNPMLLALALARRPSAPLPQDPVAALRHTITRLAAGDARRVLELLIAAEAPLGRWNLVALGGATVVEAVEALRRSSVVVCDDTSVGLPTATADLVRAVVGEPSLEVWRTLVELADRALAAAPGDPEALLLACRARTRLGETRFVLRLLHAHRGARAAAPAGALQRVLRGVAATDRACAAECHLILAREQLRWGDFAAARRTLDGILPAEFTGAHATRARVLRAETLVRAGEPESAARELERARQDGAAAEPSVGIGLAELMILRGHLDGARRILLELGPRTHDIPHLEGRRAVALGLSYFVEDRYQRAVVWARRARLAYRPRGDVPIELLAIVVEALSLLGLRLIDQTEALLAREELGAQRDVGAERLGRGVGAALRASLRSGRGDFVGSLAAAEPSFGELDERADQVARTVIARYMAWAATSLGLFERAERFLRIGAGIAAEPGLTVFLPWHDAAIASLAEARGDRSEARRRIGRALVGLPGSPHIRVEAWALGETPDSAPPTAGAPRAVRAYAELRRAERGLERGELDNVLPAAEAAERFYLQAGALHELARARLARAECLARSGASIAAHQALAACEEVAAPRRYAPILVAAALVRAALADRDGEIEAYVQALGTARAHAAGLLTDHALGAACDRLGLSVPPAVATAGSPWAGLVGRLGLARPAATLCAVGRDVRLLGPGEAPPGDVDLIADVDQGSVQQAATTIGLPPQRLLLLELLAEADPEGVTLEQLYLRLWGGHEYHPLRNRNSVYVAITRLRTSLEPLLGNRDLLERSGERYRVAPGVCVAILRPMAACRIALGRREQSRPCPGRPLASAIEHARRFGLPLAQARWEVALATAEAASAGESATAEPGDGPAGATE